MFERTSEVSLPSLNGERYGGMAYDGCHVYLTIRCQRLILQLNDCLEKERCVETRRAYTAICYDSDRHCFWASAEGCLSAVYRLNECLEEVDCLTVRGPGGCLEAVAGISYDCCKHCLLVCFADGILRLNPDQPQKTELVVRVKGEWLLGVLSLCPYILCHCMEDGAGSIRIYSGGGQLLRQWPIPCEFALDCAVFWPCVKDFCRCHFCVLRTKHCAYPCLCDCVLTWDAICDTICPCNYELCRNCPHPEPCQNACEAVLESIALMEAAIAHILNAEGEKIQKAVATTEDVGKLLAVNKSVSETLSKAIFLEQILYCKLESLGECCDFCKEEKPCKEQKPCCPDK